MKQTLLFTLSFFSIATFMTACTGQMADKMAVVGNPTLSSEPCAAIDKKVMRLDRFTEVVKNTSAFHLEEKATAIQVPGISVNNNRKQMLRDAEKKYAEYAVERQKYGCETPMSVGTGQIAYKMTVVDNPTLSSDRCTAIDKKVMRLNQFTEVVKNTSAFHLEEKATALPVPGITVSNNRKKMLKDAEKKYAEYSAERQKYGCETPIPIRTTLIVDKKEVVNKPALSSEASADSDKKIMKTDEFTTKVNHTSSFHMEEKAAVLPVERQKNSAETRIPVSNTKMVNKKVVVSKPTLSSDSCDAIDKELLKLYEFMIMVKNTSAFHLEEKAESMLVPGITVSNNKKKMLKDAERKRAVLLTERKKHGCETAEKN